MSIEAMKAALAYMAGTLKTDHATGYERKQWVMQNLRTAIEQMEKREPFGYFQYSMHMDAWVQNRDSNKGVAFYTTPLAAPYRAVKTVHEGKPVYVSEPAAPVQEPVAWPTTAQEVSDFIGGSYVWREHKISDVEPHDDDKYCVTAHDLIEAFELLVDTTPPIVATPLAAQTAEWVGLTDEDRAEVYRSIPGSEFTVDGVSRAIEAKLREKNGGAM